jgi:hypothetical protein
VPDKKWSLFENGMPGVHLILNPQKPPPPEARIYRQFVDHNITLSSRELQTLLASRGQGVTAIKNVVDKLLPGFGPDQRLSFSEQIADALLEKSLSAQLSREAPTSADRLKETEDKMNAILMRGPPASLIERVPVGVSVTVHF